MWCLGNGQTPHPDEPASCSRQSSLSWGRLSLKTVQLLGCGGLTMVKLHTILQVKLFNTLHLVQDIQTSYIYDRKN